jgi:formylglycine-generating enzyme required for sulfatase activity
MLGNVGEFVLDRMVQQMTSEDVIDPPGPDSVASIQYPTRVFRGEGFNNIAYRVRAAYRAGQYGHSAVSKQLGYRVCCDAMALK